MTVDVLVGPIVAKFPATPSEFSGFAYDTWTLSQGIKAGVRYPVIERCRYARDAEIKATNTIKGFAAIDCLDVEAFGREISLRTPGRIRK